MVQRRSRFALLQRLSRFALLQRLSRFALLQRLVHGIIQDVAELEVALREHGEAFITAYGEDACKPKFHYARHMVGQARRDGMLLDTWTCERKHSMLKAAALHIDNTRVFERSVIARALALHAASLRSGCLRDGLPRAVPCPELATAAGAHGCAIDKEMRWMGTRWGKGDMFFMNGNLFEIVCCALVEMDRPHLALAAFPFAFVAKATQVTIIHIHETIAIL